MKSSILFALSCYVRPLISLTAATIPVTDLRCGFLAIFTFAAFVPLVVAQEPKVIPADAIITKYTFDDGTASDVSGGGNDGRRTIP